MSTAARRAIFLGLIAALAGGGVSSETLFYSSDEAAYPIARIADPGLDPAKPPPERYLRIDLDAGRETRVLFESGKETERREIGPAQAPAARVERLFRSGQLVMETTTGMAGESIEERHYDGSDKQVLEWRQTYTYASGRLLEVERLSGDGESLGLLVYHFDPRGRLEELELTGYFGASKEGSIQGGSIPRLLWSDSPGEDSLRLERYGEDGRLSSVRWTRAGKDEATSSYIYDDTGLLLSLRHRDLKSGSLRVSTFGPGGRLEAEEEGKEGEKPTRRELYYDDSSRLVLEAWTWPSPAESHSYEYDGEGRLVREEFLVDSILERALVHEEDGTIVEETWARGSLVAKAYFTKGIKVREEFIVGGVVVRERSYR